MRTQLALLVAAAGSLFLAPPSQACLSSVGLSLSFSLNSGDYYYEDSSYAFSFSSGYSPFYRADSCLPSWYTYGYPLYAPGYWASPCFSTYACTPFVAYRPYSWRPVYSYSICDPYFVSPASYWGFPSSCSDGFSFGYSSYGSSFFSFSFLFGDRHPDYDWRDRSWYGPVYRGHDNRRDHDRHDWDDHRRDEHGTHATGRPFRVEADAAPGVTPIQSGFRPMAPERREVDLRPQANRTIRPLAPEHPHAKPLAPDSAHKPFPEPPSARPLAGKPITDWSAGRPITIKPPAAPFVGPVSPAPNNTAKPSPRIGSKPLAPWTRPPAAPTFGGKPANSSGTGKPDLAPSAGRGGFPAYKSTNGLPAVPPSMNKPGLQPAPTPVGKPTPSSGKPFRPVVAPSAPAYTVARSIFVGAKRYS